VDEQPQKEGSEKEGLLSKGNNCIKCSRESCVAESKKTEGGKEAHESGKHPEEHALPVGVLA